MMHDFHWVVHGVFLADVIVRLGLSARVIKRRLPVGTSLAWLAVILIFPFVGAGLYLLVGEYRLGRRRARRAAAYRETHREGFSVGRPRRGRQEQEPLSAKAAYTGGRPQGKEADRTARCGPTSPTSATSAHGAAVARLAESALGAAVLAGNRLELLENAGAAFPALIADIDRATQSCDLESYIWSAGGQADEVGAALIRAAQRGVRCLVLVDAIGSKAFLKSQSASDLRRNGVRVVAALPAGAIPLLFRRPDLRLHRKIAVFDGQVAYTGSLNIADPRLFKRDAGVGQWVDALARVQGPAVEALSATFREDWYLETEELLEPVRPSPLPLSPEGRGGGVRGDEQVQPRAGEAAVQVLPTGPDEHVEAIEQVILMALYSATREVVLTTPYFVPGESLLTALLSAAARGVEVTLIVPAKVDSHLVHFASRAFQRDLLAAGVRLALFQGGLLHTKSITVDGQFSLFGSVNLDPRSLRLDFEITLAVYDAAFTAALRRLQQFYLEGSTMLDLETCRARSAVERFAEDAARLVGPIL